MFRKILGLLILGLVLASCGTPVPTGGLKDVGATSAAGGVTVKWTFDGDKTKIKGFRIFRNAGGNGTSYTKLADVLNVNAINYSDTVEQGESFKYGVAVINTDNTVGSTLNQTGVAVGPNPVTGTGSMNGKWTMDSKITEAPADKQDEIGREFFFILDITETSGVLSGTLDFRIPDSTHLHQTQILVLVKKK